MERSVVVGRLDEWGDDHAAVGLVALREGLDAGAVSQVVVDDFALRGGHRLELDLLARLARAGGGTLGLVFELLAAALAVAAGVDHHALSVRGAALGSAVTDELNRVDRLAAATDQAGDVL